MQRPNVIIPSRGRWIGARKLTQAWHDEGFNVYWMVEPQEYDKYFDAIVGTAPITGPPGSDRPSTFISVLPRSEMGITYSRHQCVQMAERNDWYSFILADDDIKPAARGGKMLGMVNAARNPKVLGITAKYSYHDLCLGEDVKTYDNVILLSTGTFRLVALNTENVLKLGNYDIHLDYAEDCDLFLRGLKAGYPWMLDAGTWSNSIGTRYQPGGMVDFVGGLDKLAPEKEYWHDDLHAKWPQFVNEHNYSKCKGKQNCIRIQWKKAYDTFLPQWRDWSDLDGGSISRYFNA